MIWFFLGWIVGAYFTMTKVLETNFFGAAAAQAPGTWLGFALIGVAWPVVAIEMLNAHFEGVEPEYPNVDFFNDVEPDKGDLR